MSKILLSIKPEYAHKILEGTKKYEFRKHLPKKKIEKIIIYSTAPDGSVIGEVHVDDILTGSPSAVWEKSKKNAGISREKYREYFKGCKNAVAFCLSNPIVYENRISLSDLGIDFYPQSFVYLD